MAALNLSTNGPSISKSYQLVVNAPAPSGPAANSGTYGQWAVFSVSAPLANAFQQDAAGKESVLKVQSTGEGELLDLVEEFSDGRIQFAFVRVKDPNTALPKFALIGWCGEGVPERTKGYFTSHLAAVSKIFTGYHVQITARSDSDLTPESIVQKVSDASGSKYSGSSGPPSGSSGGPPPPAASKPAFTPTRVGGGANSGFNPLGGARARGGAAGKDTPTDADGWGDDAPQVTRTQLEKVESAYKPTKVNLADLRSQHQDSSRSSGGDAVLAGQEDVVKGGYQPVGKVDIAALRRQAKESTTAQDDRPTAVKGAYEPVGKVDIAAIRARAQPRSDETAAPAAPSSISPAATGQSGRSADESPEPKSLAERSGAFTQSERMTALPKPKVSNRFGGGSSFTGTKAPAPGGFGVEPKPNTAAPVGTTSRTFADEGGKTPAQIWAEKKARERGLSGAGDTAPPAAQPVASQPSGEWKSGYSGKSWAPVQTTSTGRSGVSNASREEEETAREEAGETTGGGVGALRDRFKGAAPMGAPAAAKSPGEEAGETTPPALDVSSKPNVGGGIAIPGLPTRPKEESSAAPAMPSPPAVPRSPTPPTPDEGPRASSPIRVAMPVSRSREAEMSPPAERYSPEPVPTDSLADAAPDERDMADEATGHDAARAAGEAAAAASFGAGAAQDAQPSATTGGKRALAKYDYNIEEDNELPLVEGEYITIIEIEDPDWWMGQNERGEQGLFPSNYVEVVEGEEEEEAAPEPVARPAEPTPVAAAPETAAARGKSAVAIYDYEAAEENELSFPEHAVITGVEFPDDDWWSGHYNGHEGLFPANYVELQN